MLRVAVRLDVHEQHAIRTFVFAFWIHSTVFDTFLSHCMKQTRELKKKHSCSGLLVLTALIPCPTLLREEGAPSTGYAHRGVRTQRARPHHH